MGDLSGGQEIKWGVIGSSALGYNAGQGTRLYCFKQLDSANVADMGHNLRIKQCIRDGTEEGASSDPAKNLITDHLRRSHTRLLLNMDIFVTFRPPSPPLTRPEQNPSPNRSTNSLTESTSALATVISVVIGFAKLEVLEQWAASLFSLAPPA